MWLSFDPVHKVIPAFVTGRICHQHADTWLEETKRGNDGSLHVFFSDQRPHYPGASLSACGRWEHPQRKGSRGRVPNPSRIPPEDLLSAQGVKPRRNGRVVRVTSKVSFGTPQALED